jgi:hypothetical protein
MSHPALLPRAHPMSRGWPLPHARSPPPMQVRDGRHVGTPTRELQAFPRKAGSGMSPQDRGN